MEIILQEKTPLEHGESDKLYKVHLSSADEKTIFISIFYDSDENSVSIYVDKNELLNSIQLLFSE